MTALLQLQLKKMTRRLLPTWLLRLVGFLSVGITIVNFVILLCRRFPPPTCQFIKKATSTTSSLKTLELNNTLIRTSSSLANIQQDKVCLPSPPYARTPSTQLNSRKWWGQRLVDYVIVAASVLKQKKKLTISLKNTILWNPSQDITIANHAFNEYAIPLLSRLCQQYEVYLLIHTNNDDEHDQIQRLLAPIISSSSPIPPLLTKSRIIYCPNEMTKVHMVRSVLCPEIHVEGGCELNDGENVIRGLQQSSVGNIVWVITRRRRASFNKDNMKPKDQDILTDGLELTNSLLDSSLAREVGFFID